MILPAPLMIKAVMRGLGEQHGLALSRMDGGLDAGLSQDSALLIALVAAGRITPAMLLLCADDAEIRAEILAGYGTAAKVAIREAAKACGCVNCRRSLAEIGEPVIEAKTPDAESILELLRGIDLGEIRRDRRGPL